MVSLNKIMEKLGFERKSLIQFIVVAIGSQTIFSFYAIRSVLYNPMVEAMGVTHTEFGVLMSLTGIGTIFAALLGFIQNRFSPKLLLVTGLATNGIGVLIIATLPSYNVLLVVFSVMGFIGMGIFWPALLNEVRQIGSDEHQGTAFGFLEFIRRGTELIQNVVAVGIFAVIGGVYGIQVLMVIWSIMILLLAVLYFVVIPSDKERDKYSAEEQNRLAWQGMKMVLLMPEVWLVGFTAAGIYSAYVGLQYFLPFLNSVFVVPVIAGAIFGLINTSFTGMFASPLSGVFADNIFKSPIRYLSVLMSVLCIGLFVLMNFPRGESMLIFTIILLLVVAFMIYLGRGVYYAPIGEMGMPKEISGGAMAVASFVGYSPMFFAYVVYGYQIDNFEPKEAYDRVFFIMFICASIGLISSLILNYRFKRRANDKIDLNESYQKEI